MDSEELNKEILKLTMTIQEKYPELSKYLDEMPVSIPNIKEPEISLKNLKAYYDSLNSLLQHYIENHASEEAK